MYNAAIRKIDVNFLFIYFFVHTHAWLNCPNDIAPVSGVIVIGEHRGVDEWGSTSFMSMYPVSRGYRSRFSGTACSNLTKVASAWISVWGWFRMRLVIILTQGFEFVFGIWTGTLHTPVGTGWLVWCKARQSAARYKVSRCQTLMPTRFCFLSFFKFSRAFGPPTQDAFRGGNSGSEKIMRTS